MRHGRDITAGAEAFLDFRVSVLIGDVRSRLRDLPDDHFDCVVTSPPYWGLRDYGVEGQIGMEPSVGAHLEAMMDVFEEVRRVLKPSGTCWVNYGDCYATSPNGRSASENNAGCYLKPKDLVMMPNRFAIAMQDAGWWVRSEIIWGKPNAMPDSSGRFRPATAHEKIFLFTKSDEPEFWVARDTGEISQDPDFSEQAVMISTITDKCPEGRLGPRWIALGHYYNAEAVRIDAATTGGSKMPDGWSTSAGGHGSFHPQGREPGRRVDKQRGHSRRHDGFNARWDAMTRAEQCANGRLLRNYEPAGPVPVWELATAAFRDAHFATFPPGLVERCLRGGCPKGGRVLDPFGGAGTTGMVAAIHGYEATLIELNPEYAEMARRRIAACFTAGPATRRAERSNARGKTDDAGPLFRGSK